MVMRWLTAGRLEGAVRGLGKPACSSAGASRACSAGSRPCPVRPCPSPGPLTGEPYAGKPPVRFGGRGGRETGHPYPYPASERDTSPGDGPRLPPLFLFFFFFPSPVKKKLP